MNKNEYEIIPTDKLVGYKDLQLVGTLIYLGLKMVSMEYQSGRSKNAIFYFTKSSALHGTVDKYWSGEIRVEPQRFNSVIRDIKSRLYNTIQY